MSEPKDNGKVETPDAVVEGVVDKIASEAPPGPPEGPPLVVISVPLPYAQLMYRAVHDWSPNAQDSQAMMMVASTMAAIEQAANEFGALQGMTSAPIASAKQE